MLFHISMIVYLFRWRIGVDGMLWRLTTCSTWIINGFNIFCTSHSSSSHLFLLLVFMFLLVYPLAATPLFSTMLACSAERRVLVCTIGTSPLSMRWWVVDACTLFTTPIIVSARTCQQWQVPPWSWILRTRRVDSSRATYELHGVAANG